MENKKYTKIKVKDSYGTTVIKKLPEDPNGQFCLIPLS